ncbi:MAG TPA: hypothetical protein ENG11_05385, partial [candidate division Zixibacteria bacterium]|nr:hypothetical protein [candidate division Zixibacteria bacterium]
MAGCDTQIVKILWYDPDGIDRSESWISVNGDTVSAAAPEIVWTGDTVGIAVGGVDTAELILHGVDGLGFDSQDTFVIVFDRQPPIVRCISPSPESSLITVPERMVFVVDDSPAGPNWSTLSLIVNGDLFTAGDESITISGDTVIFNTAAAELPETENLSVAIHISDMAYTCPNATDTSFEFHIVRPEFWWELVAPQGISACESVEVLAVFHANFEIAYDSLKGALGENAVNIAHSGDTAAVLLPGHFLNSGVNTLAVWNIMDTTGRIKIDDTVFVPVLYDASAPSILPIYPPPGENVPAGASVVALVYDDFSGVDRGGVIVEFNGTPHLPEDINWHGDTLVMPLPENILGEVEVCITASDMPDLCAPHSHRLCWEFNIPGVGPSVQIIEPENGAFTHNPTQKIVAKISAENGIERSGILMRINGREYPADSPEISLSGDTLIFTPAVNWQDGDTVNFEFILTDNLGLMTETNSYFICDFSPPV